MTEDQAIKLAIEALRQWISELDVNANLYEWYGMPSGKASSEKRRRLGQAIEKLQATVAGEGEG